jgi:hypothetical protein
MIRAVVVIVLSLIAASCATAGDGAHFKPTNGLGTAWVVTAGSLVGLLFPDIASRFLKIDDRNLVRLACGALLFIGAAGLADYYLDLNAASSMVSGRNGS